MKRSTKFLDLKVESPNHPVIWTPSPKTRTGNKYQSACLKCLKWPIMKLRVDTNCRRKKRLKRIHFGHHSWSTQVCPLTQFYALSFLLKIIDLPGGQINDPFSGKHYSLPFLPATPSFPSRTIEGLFELTRRPSRALHSPCALLPELQRSVRCGTVGAEVPGHRQNAPRLYDC